MTARQSAQEGPYRTAPLHPATLGQLDAVEPALWPILPELGYHGIFLKPGATYHRQPCPVCPPPEQRISRNGRPMIGSKEKPLRVRITSATTATIHCPKCKLHKEIEA